MRHVIINPGHGKSTPGKCAPDKSYFEWEGNRARAKALGDALKAKGYEVHYVVEPTDPSAPSLTQRGKIANKYVSQYGAKNCVYISKHSNAAGNGGWYNARGWSIYTTRGQNNSDKLAEFIWKAATKYVKGSIRVNMSDGDHDVEANFQEIKEVNCPAVLIEEFFHTNKEDIKYGTSQEGIKDYTNACVEGIDEYFKSKGL